MLKMKKTRPTLCMGDVCNLNAGVYKLEWGSHCLRPTCCHTTLSKGG